MRSEKILSPEQHRALKALLGGPLLRMPYGQWSREGFTGQPFRTHTLRALVLRCWIPAHFIHTKGERWQRIEQLAPFTGKQKEQFDAFATRYKGVEPPAARIGDLIQTLVDVLHRHNVPLQAQEFFTLEEQSLAVDTHNAMVLARQKGFTPKEVAAPAPCGTGTIDRVLLLKECTVCPVGQRTLCTNPDHHGH